jgi:hypothetical protein
MRETRHPAISYDARKSGPADRRNLRGRFSSRSSEEKNAGDQLPDSLHRFGTEQRELPDIFQARWKLTETRADRSSDASSLAGSAFRIASLPSAAALADLIPRLASEVLRTLRIEMLANNEVVMKEMERRGPPPPPQVFKLARYGNRSGVRPAPGD